MCRRRISQYRQSKTTHRPCCRTCKGGRAIWVDFPFFHFFRVVFFQQSYYYYYNNNVVCTHLHTYRNIHIIIIISARIYQRRRVCAQIHNKSVFYIMCVVVDVIFRCTTELLSSQISLVCRTRKRKIFPYTPRVYLVQPKNKSVRKTCFFLHIHSTSLPKCVCCVPSTTVKRQQHTKKN